MVLKLLSESRLEKCESATALQEEYGCDLSSEMNEVVIQFGPNGLSHLQKCFESPGYD